MSDTPKPMTEQDAVASILEATTLIESQASEIAELKARLERLTIEYDEVRMSRPHSRFSPQHGNDITLCGLDCEGRATSNPAKP